MNLERLSELAGKATPGPWTPIDPGLSGMICAGSPERPIAEVRGWGWLQKLGVEAGARQQDANRDFIAACDPDTVRALVEVARAAEALRDFRYSLTSEMSFDQTIECEFLGKRLDRALAVFKDQPANPEKTT